MELADRGAYSVEDLSGESGLCVFVGATFSESRRVLAGCGLAPLGRATRVFLKLAR